MNLLLDSHAFVWMHEEAHKLSVKASYEILNPANQIFLSVANIWELQIKIRVGKFSFSDTLENVVTQERQTNNLQYFARPTFTRFVSGKSAASS